jgi:hypothetical protein
MELMELFTSCFESAVTEWHTVKQNAELSVCWLVTLHNGTLQPDLTRWMLRQHLH